MSFDPAGRGGRRTKLAGFSFGHVFRLPPGATWLNPDKPRPYVLATRCTPAEPGMLAYGSTKAAQKHLGAACIEVPPTRTGVNANGLDLPTFFYPGILLPYDYDDLPPHTGVLGPAMKPFRAAIRTALGIGTGSCLAQGVPAGSRRGKIVVLEDSLASWLRGRHAVLLTEHAYSRERAYHVAVPIISGEERVSDPTVLRVREAPWMELFNPRPESVLLPPPVIQSVWYGRDIVHETKYVLDEDTLVALERQLCAIFGLAPA